MEGLGGSAFLCRDFMIERKLHLVSQRRCEERDSLVTLSRVATARRRETGAGRATFVSTESGQHKIGVPKVAGSTKNAILSSEESLRLIGEPRHIWDVVFWIKQLLGSMRGEDDMVHVAKWDSERVKWRRRGLIPVSMEVEEIGAASFPEHLLEGMRLVDCLQGLGIAHLFKQDIQQFLHLFHSRCQVNPCGMPSLDDTAVAFRILRQHGFQVSPADMFNRFRKPNGALVSHEDSVRDLLSFHRATQRAFPGEHLLEEGRLAAMTLLQEKSAQTECEEKFRNYRSELWYSTPRRSEIRQYIEAFLSNEYSWASGQVNSQMKLADNPVQSCKGEWSACQVKEALHELAKTNFNKEQAQYRDSWEQLQKWQVESRLDELQYGHRNCAFPIFFAVYAVFQSLNSEAFMAYAKMSVLIVLLDDYFDLKVDSLQQGYKLVEAFKRWDPSVIEHGSEVQKILFGAIYQTINTISDAAFRFQGRDVGPQIRAACIPLLDAFLTEAEWSQNKYVPPVDEYLEVTTISLGLDPILLSAMFLMDENLTDAAIASDDFRHLMHLVNRIGRLQNDMQTYEREMHTGKINSLTIYTTENEGLSVQDVQRQLLKMAFDNMKEIVREVYSHQQESDPAEVPPNCRMVVLDAAFCCCFFYQSDDEMGGLKAKKLGLIQSLLTDPIL